MKKHLLKTLLLCLLALTGTTAFAYDCKVNGIYYDLNATDQTASVTYSSIYGDYSGVVHIPERIVYNGITYSITSIGNEAFWFCSGLTELTIPNSVTSIGNYAFSECYGLTELTIPNSVTSIGNEAFHNCHNLTKLIIGNSVTAIGERAFYYCTRLAKIVVEAGNPCYDSRENCNAIIYTDGEKATLMVGCKNTRIPNSVTAIGNYAFRNCIGLTELTIPNSVASIGDGAFRGCSGLETIIVETGNPYYDSRENCNAIIRTDTNSLIAGCKNTHIPNSITSIADGAFAACEGLMKLTIPNNVTSIGNEAFAWCTNLTELTIGNSVTSIGDEAFSNCSRLISITSLNTTPPAASYYTFDYYIQQNAMLHVPAGCKEAYAQAECWKDFLNIQEDAVDGIAPVVAGQQPTTDAIYTLDGMKLNTTSLQDLPSGIYIVNGKKVSVKNP